MFRCKLFLTLFAFLLLRIVDSNNGAEEFARIGFPINDGESFALNVGTPAQFGFRAAFDLFERDLLVIDHKCGLQRADCPRYCKDVLFFFILCSPACDPARPDITRLKYCGGRPGGAFFWAENSTTFVEERPPKEWAFRSQDFYASTGHWAEDTLGFWTGAGFDWTVVPQVRFVLVEYTDSRLFRHAYSQVDVILGLAPGPTAFVPQLFAQRRIAVATITIAPTDRFSGVGYVGREADDRFCDNAAWKAVRTPNETNWFLEAKSIRIGDLVFFDQLVALTPTQQLEVPDDLLAQLLERKMLYVMPRTLVLTTHCNSTALDVTVEFEGGAEISIPSSALIDTHGWETATGRCFTSFAGVPAARYARTAGWTVGNFLAAKCVRLDYEQHAMGISDALLMQGNE